MGPRACARPGGNAAEDNRKRVQKAERDVSLSMEVKHWRSNEGTCAKVLNRNKTAQKKQNAVTL